MTTNSLRVALIAPPFEAVPPKLYGGTERVVHHLAQGLTEIGAQVTLFASGDSQSAGQLVPITPEALRLMQHPPAELGTVHTRMLLQIQKHLRNQQAFESFDIIHNHHDFWMLPLAGSQPAPVVTTLHGRLDLPDFLPVWRSAPPSHRYISISHSQREPAPDLPWIENIPHGIPFDDYPFQAQPGKYLAFLGRICPEKRPEWAVQIALQSGIPLKIAAKIEGKSGRDWYDAMIKPHVDGRFIEYIGEIAEHEKGEFLGNALGLAFPIDWPEPFGLVMIESLACGTPVLARPVGSVPEILEHGRTAYIESGLTQLSRAALQLEKLSRSECRRVAEERFSLKRMVEAYLDVYRRVGELGNGVESRHRRNFLHPIERPLERYTETHTQRQSRLRGLGHPGRSAPLRPPGR